MADMKALIKELADWDRQCFPLGGGNLIDLLVTHGLLSAEEAERLYKEAMTELGESDLQWPPAIWQETEVDGPAKQAWRQRDDDEIAF